jgi:hypothetical protein
MTRPQLTWKDGIHGTVANADKLDNKDSSEFLGKTEKASDSALFDGKDPSAFLGADQKATDAEKLDGIDSTDFAKAYKRTVVVSPVGTDAQNGQALLDAMASITDASASKPYLLHIEPGTYDLGNSFDSNLRMKEWVDIEGSGENNTVITSGRPGNADGGCSATVTGANNAEMRFLTVRNTGGACAISSFNHASPRLTHLTAQSTGDRGTAGVFVFDSSTTMNDVTATASGLGSVGVLIDLLGSVTITHSKLSGSFALRWDPQSSDTTKIALSQLVGLRDVSSGPNLQCFNNYDQNLAAVSCSR